MDTKSSKHSLGNSGLLHRGGYHHIHKGKTTIRHSLRETMDLRSSRVVMILTSLEKELLLGQMKTSLEKMRIETLHHENSEKRRNKSKLDQGYRSHKPNTAKTS